MFIYTIIGNLIAVYLDQELIKINQDVELKDVLQQVNLQNLLSRIEGSALTNYSVSTIRSKGSKGESITTRNGLTYRYDKNTNVLKWVRV